MTSILCTSENSVEVGTEVVARLERRFSPWIPDDAKWFHSCVSLWSAGRRERVFVFQPLRFVFLCFGSLGREQCWAFFRPCIWRSDLFGLNGSKEDLRLCLPY